VPKSPTRCGHPLAIVPQHLDQPAALATEHEQMPRCGSRFSVSCINQQRQAIEAATHIRQPARQPHPRPGSQPDHRPSAASSTAASTRMHAPAASSISIVPGALAARPGVTVTGSSAAARRSTPLAPPDASEPRLLRR